MSDPPVESGGLTKKPVFHYNNYGSTQWTSESFLLSADYLTEEMSPNEPELIVRRPIYQQDELHRACDYRKPHRTLRRTVSKKFKNFETKSCMKSALPIVDWLGNYQWKENLLGDVAAGITVAVMHIPQGMAYAILGNVPPIIGIYMAFFPVLVYAIFGTSRHNSMGTFALICMMTGKVVLTHSDIGNALNATKYDDEPTEAGLHSPDHYTATEVATAVTFGVAIMQANLYSPDHYTATEVATAVTFGVAIMQLGMYVLRLGVISSLLSETLVSGFTTAAAIHVFTSQIKDILGLQLPRRKGIFKVILTYIDVFNNIDDINVTAAVISGITILAIVFNNEVLKPRISKRCSFPVPIEMIAVVIGTLISIQMNLAEDYNVVTVGHIPVGLPIPALPPMDLMSKVLVDSFVITMVSYSISMSMALIFAQKMNYEVNANQELIAQGLGNLVGSFFSCMPFTASLSRSLVQFTVGGRTQLASLISCGLLLFVLLWIGPFLEPLPRCVLAGIIVVALKGMFLQVSDLCRFWRLSSTDAMIWIATFLSVIILDIEYGLLIGALFCLAKLMTLSMKPYTCKLGLVPGTELYLDVNRYKKTVQIPGIQMFHYCGGLNFATKLNFRKEVFKAAGVIPQEELSRRLALPSKQIATEEMIKLRVLILDFSALVHVDPTGVATLRSIVDDYRKIGVAVYLAGCSGPVYETMRKCNVAERKEGHFTMFPTVNDAVNYARHENVIPPIVIPSTTPLWTTCQQQIEDENYMSRL